MVLNIIDTPDRKSEDTSRFSDYFLSRKFRKTCWMNYKTGVRSMKVSGTKTFTSYLLYQYQIIWKYNTVLIFLHYLL